MEDLSFIELWGKAVTGIGGKYLLIAGAAFVLTYFVFRKRLMNRKIQLKFPKISDYRRDMVFSLITIAIFGVQAVLVLFVFEDKTQLYNDPLKIGWVYNFFTFFVMVFMHDTYFYWTHRAMHHPKLFKWFHLTHHKSHNPSPWSSYAFHPLEAVVEGGIIPVIAFTLPVWKPMLVLFLLFQLVINVYGHTGFELFPKGFHKTKIGRYINTSVAHNMHHKYFKGNYSLYFMIWDRLMGTVHEKYDDNYEEITRGK